MFLQVLHNRTDSRTACHRNLAERIRELGGQASPSGGESPQQTMYEVTEIVKKGTLWELLEVLDTHTKNRHVRDIVLILHQKYPREFKDYDNLRGPGKRDKLDNILDVLRAYEDIDAICEAILKVKPDDQKLQKKLRKWGYDC